MKKLAILALLLAAPAGATGITRYSSTQAATGASAPTTASTWLRLDGVTRVRVSICAAAGQTLSGSGTVAMYYWEEGGNLVSYDPDGVFTVTASSVRCQTFLDREVKVPIGGMFLLPVAVGISGGTNVTIYITAWKSDLR